MSKTIGSHIKWTQITTSDIRLKAGKKPDEQIHREVISANGDLFMSITEDDDLSEVIKNQLVDQ